MRAYRCAASGLYYPEDYMSEWGIKYGIGLGPTPVSETWQSEYNLAPPAITPGIRQISQIMHPCYVCKAQLDLVEVTEQEFEANKAILDVEDPFGEQRAAIVREKQLANPRGRLRTMQAAWARDRGEERGF